MMDHSGNELTTTLCDINWVFDMKFKTFLKYLFTKLKVDLSEKQRFPLIHTGLLLLCYLWYCSYGICKCCVIKHRVARETLLPFCQCKDVKLYI